MQSLIVFSLLVAFAAGAEIGWRDSQKLRMTAVAHDHAIGTKSRQTQVSSLLKQRAAASTKSTLLASHQVRGKTSLADSDHDAAPWAIDPTFEEILETADLRMSPETNPFFFYDYAKCELEPAENSLLSVQGEVFIHQQKDGGVMHIHGHIWGFEDDKPHAWTVNEWGDLSKSCNSTGAHYNPYGNKHGSHRFPISDRHLGDIGNAYNDTDGWGFFVDDLWLTLKGPQGIYGRSIVVYENADDGGLGGDAESLRTGNVGNPVACCIIGTFANSDRDIDDWRDPPENVVENIENK